MEIAAATEMPDDRESQNPAEDPLVQKFLTEHPDASIFILWARTSFDDGGKTLDLYTEDEEIADYVSDNTPKKYASHRVCVMFYDREAEA